MTLDQRRRVTTKVAKLKCRDLWRPLQVVISTVTSFANAIKVFPGRQQNSWSVMVLSPCVIYDDICAVVEAAINLLQLTLDTRVKISAAVSISKNSRCQTSFTIVERVIINWRYIWCWYGSPYKLVKTYWLQNIWCKIRVQLMYVKESLH